MTRLILVDAELKSLAWSNPPDGVVTLEADRAGRGRYRIDHVLETEDRRQTRTVVGEYKTESDDEYWMDDDDMVDELALVLHDLAPVLERSVKALPPASVAVYGSGGRYWMEVDPADIDPADYEEDEESESGCDVHVSTQPFLTVIATAVALVVVGVLLAKLFHF